MRLWPRAYTRVTTSCISAPASPTRACGQFVLQWQACLRTQRRQFVDAVQFTDTMECTKLEGKQGLPMMQLIPQPVSARTTGELFTVTPATTIVVAPDTPELRRIAEHLATALRASAGCLLPVGSAPGAVGNSITLALSTGEGYTAGSGPEGYTLSITPAAVQITADRPAGLFYGVQTLRQLVPPAAAGQPLTLPGCEIVDAPRFGWRGMMLDVARHFFAVADVKRLIDLLAFYKLNRLHLHLSDDQGWRIEIRSWPRLTEVGGQTAVNNEGGGFYTQAEYAELVNYAADRCITIVPEIDLPGHTNAALAAYAELNCDGQARPPFTGIEVGFSSLCVDKELTYRFLDDVLGELAALTPGPYIHIGGDEAMATPPDAYRRFMERVQPLVHKHGKQIIGWEELGQARLLPGTLVQHWNTNPAQARHADQAVAQGAKVIMSPADRVYIDMKYDKQTPLGLQWAAYIEVRDAYDWDPATLMPGVGEDAIVGVEAPMWAETLKTLADIEYMAFPRLPGVAEIGWSPAGGRTWEEYRRRLAAHAAHWQAMGINFYRSPQIDWQD